MWMENWAKNELPIRSGRPVYLHTDANLHRFTGCPRRQQPTSGSRGLAWRASATRPSLLRRPDRTLSAAGAACGATSPPSARRQLLGVPSAGRTTRRPTTGALWRGAMSSGATNVYMWWPSAETALDRTSPRPTCTQRRGRPDRWPRGGGHHPHHVGSAGRQPLPRTRPQIAR